MITITKPLIICGGNPHITCTLTGSVVCHITDTSTAPPVGKPQVIVKNVILSQAITTRASRLCLENVGIQDSAEVLEMGDLDVAMANVRIQTESIF